MLDDMLGLGASELQALTDLSLWRGGRASKPRPAGWTEGEGLATCSGTGSAAAQLRARIVLLLSDGLHLLFVPHRSPA
jgi:hypothetical protein